MNAYDWAYAAIVLTLGVVLAVLFWLSERHDRRRHAAQAAALDAAIAEEQALSLFVDDPAPDDEPTPDEEPTVEVATDLPLRARQIDAPREGAVLQGRWRPHTACVDAWADREQSRIRSTCAPVFGKEVAA